MQKANVALLVGRKKAKSFKVFTRKSHEDMVSLYYLKESTTSSKERTRLRQCTKDVKATFHRGRIVAH